MPRLSSNTPKALEATVKKARLTTAQLAAYDDVLTDVLVDHVRVFGLLFIWCKLTLHARYSHGMKPARRWALGR